MGTPGKPQIREEQSCWAKDNWDENAKWGCGRVGLRGCWKVLLNTVLTQAPDLLLPPPPTPHNPFPSTDPRAGTMMLVLSSYHYCFFFIFHFMYVMTTLYNVCEYDCVCMLGCAYEHVCVCVHVKAYMKARGWFCISSATTPPLVSSGYIQFTQVLMAV